MKQFTTSINQLHEAEAAAKSELQKSYEEYFTAKLKKFDVESPADLTPEQKSEFYEEISKDWTAGKGATAAGKKDMEKNA